MPLIEWKSHPKDDGIRCPYCVQNGNFRLMSRQSGEDWFFSNGRGHLALSGVPSYRYLRQMRRIV